MATIAVDFDGTIVTHEYPKIGTELPFATETLKMLIRDHHKLILWSVREGKLLDEAVEWCRERGVEFWAVNKDYPEESLENNNHFSRKLKADWFIDDRGMPSSPLYRLVRQMRVLPASRLLLNGRRISDLQIPMPMCDRLSW